MITRSIAEFDADKTARSGQCFRFGRLAAVSEKGTVTGPEGDAGAGRAGDASTQGRFSLIASGHYLEIEPSSTEPDGLSAFRLSCTEEEFTSFWSDYLDLDTDYRAIRSLVDPADAHLLAAAGYGAGIRILRQDLWEVMVAFLISQNNNIVRITRSIEGLCGQFGEEASGLTLDGDTVAFKTFPTPSALASATDDDLLRLGLGYRTPYVASLSRKVASGELDLIALRNDPGICEVHAQLVGLLGVGPKVASCIELFGLHQLSACPIDTWMRKVIDQRYGGSFPWERYAGYEGIIQQYLFFYERESARR